MNLSRLASSIAESPTLKLNALAKSMQAQGIPVIHLGGGEPKNKAPLSAIEAATAYLAAGDVKYTPSAGTASLRKAAAEYTGQNYGRKAAVENIIISSGAKQTLYNLLFTLLDPGDEVIVPAPFWVSYPEMIRMTGGNPVIVASSPETLHTQAGRPARRRDHAHESHPPQQPEQSVRRALWRGSG